MVSDAFFFAASIIALRFFDSDSITADFVPESIGALTDFLVAFHSLIGRVHDSVNRLCPPVEANETYLYGPELVALKYEWHKIPLNAGGFVKFALKSDSFFLNPKLWRDARFIDINLVARWCVSDTDKAVSREVRLVRQIDIIQASVVVQDETIRGQCGDATACRSP